MEKKKTIILLSIIISVFLLVLSFGKIDYNISNYLINEQSMWAGFFNIFGHFPALLGLLISTLVLYGGRKENSIYNNKFYFIIPHTFLLVFSYAMVFTTAKYMFKITHIYNMVVVILSIVIYVFCLIIIKQFSREKLKGLKSSAVALLVLIFSEIIIVNILKIIWARPRMRTLESFEVFKYWWQINGPLNNDDFKSFPSGHTANAFVAIGALFFIPKNKNSIRKVVLLFALIWGVLTALSRIVLGAHFLSDVIFAGYITVLLFYVIDRFNKRLFQSVI